MAVFNEKIWVPYEKLTEFPEQKQRQIKALNYTEIYLDNYTDMGALSFCYVPLARLEVLERNCMELYNAINVTDTETSVCNEVYYTTKIEGAHTTRKRTQEIHNGAPVDTSNFTSEKMVENGFKATKFLNVSGNKVNKNNIRRLWEILIEDVCDNEDIKGTLYRSGEIQISNVYGLMPEQIETAMDNWLSYYNGETDNEMPFLKAALLHYSFERIHPFCDGNGRMGRMLSSNFLIRLGYEKIRAVSFSMAIGKHSSGYYDSMRDAGNNYFDCTPFLSYMMEREANALAYAYLQYRLGKLFVFVPDEEANNCVSKEQCDAIISRIREECIDKSVTAHS